MSYTRTLDLRRPITAVLNRWYTVDQAVSSSQNSSGDPLPLTSRSLLLPLTALLLFFLFSFTQLHLRPGIHAFLLSLWILLHISSEQEETVGANGQSLRSASPYIKQMILNPIPSKCNNAGSFFSILNNLNCWLPTAIWFCFMFMKTNKAHSYRYTYLKLSLLISIWGSETVFLVPEPG